MVLCAVTLVFGTIGLAGAVPIVFTDTTWFTDNGTNPEEDYVSHGWGDVNRLDGWHDLTDGLVAGGMRTGHDYVKWTHHFPFDPPAAEVLSGTVTLWLSDDEDDPWWQPCEFALGWGEDRTWGFGEVDSGDYSYDVTASYLEDGEFTITLVSLWGDFFIDKSDLEITYNPVPEPSTMLLLGCGLIGLAGFGRKRLFKK